MKENDLVVSVNDGNVWKVVRVEEGQRILKLMPKDTKYDKDNVFYCFNSMLRPMK